MTKKKILVAMSGGVDSSVAAGLLKEAGHEVAGATIRTWAPNACSNLNTRACCGLTGVEDAREVADKIGIRYWVFNFEEDFKKYVVDHFASEYLAGRTPNPCISCNEHIKFRLFLKRARGLGFDAIATGHYAQLGFDEACASYYIKEGSDLHKDQSYVLFPLDQDVLANLALPVGGFSKAEIREKAKEFGFHLWAKPDSQEICFIPSNDHGEFLKREYVKDAKPGEIKMKSGEVVGKHEGFFHYTRGQRRGLGVAASERLYVTETDPEKNEVVLGLKEDVLSTSCIVRRVNWMIKPAHLSSLQVTSSSFPHAVRRESDPRLSGRDDALVQRGDDEKKAITIRTHIKIRSQHQKASAVLTVQDDNSVQITFDDPQEAITAGQAAVFYDGERVLGGGWIDQI